MRLKRELREGLTRPVVFDGAMGTMLIAAGLPPGSAPETWNTARPEAVTAIHLAYAEAGAQVLTTNTFGANRIKLAHYGLSAEVERLNRGGVVCARAAAGDQRLVAGCVGPTGRLMAPFGPLGFEEAYEVFAEQCQALAAGGADLILIETMSDLAEARVAVIAARERTGLPVACTMTFDTTARTLGGAEPEAAAALLAALGCDIVGANCSVGPEDLVPVVARMAAVTRRPILVQPNAGLPVVRGSATEYPLEPSAMGQAAVALVQAGAGLVGGCCGTSPDHIRAVAASIQDLATGRARAVLAGADPAGMEPAGMKPAGVESLWLVGRGRAVAVGRDRYPVVIGERINPTARKKLGEALTRGEYGVLRDEALAQIEAGANALDVNVGLPGIDEVQAMREAVNAVQIAAPVPLSIDSARPEVVAAGLAACHGRALLNSVNGQEEVLARLLPVARRYGAAVLGLTLDERGIPATARERLAVAERIVAAALSHGLTRSDVLIDCLVLSAGAEQALVGETLEAIRLVREELGVGTVLGISNVSHGLPGRPALNAAYLAMALAAGLDAAIANPLDARMWESLRAAAVLTNRDPHASAWIPFAGAMAPQNPVQAGAANAGGASGAAIGGAAGVAGANGGWRGRLRDAVIYGDKVAVVRLVDEGLSADSSPLQLLDEILVPALTEVGRRYERGEFYLPQLMLAAESMKAAFARLGPLLETGDGSSRTTVVLATVQGDIHDIGKNIVAVMLANHGFEVVDLGRDVRSEAIVEAAIQHQARLVGLSALMTTTMREMPRVIEELRLAGSSAQVMVGGAVVTPAYATEIGADGYARDAVAAVAEAKRLTALADGDGGHTS